MGLIAGAAFQRGSSPDLKHVSVVERAGPRDRGHVVLAVDVALDRAPRVLDVAAGAPQVGHGADPLAAAGRVFAVLDRPDDVAAGFVGA